jgi:hypothetical protein
VFVTRGATLRFAVAPGLPALVVYARRKQVSVQAAGFSAPPH